MEFPVFMLLLVSHWRTRLLQLLQEFPISSTRGGGSNPIAATLKHAYFFDDAYYAFAKGLAKISVGLESMENGITRGINFLGASTMRAATKTRKVPTGSVQNYIAAAVLGFVLIFILILLTVGV